MQTRWLLLGARPLLSIQMKGKTGSPYMCVAGKNIEIALLHNIAGVLSCSILIIVLILKCRLNYCLSVCCLAFCLLTESSVYSNTLNILLSVALLINY